MKRLLCWCIWLLVIENGQLVIENGQLRIDNCLAATQSVSRGGVCTQTKSQPEARIVHSQLSILNSPELSIVHSQLSIIPCTDSSPACLEILGNLAVQNSREIAVVEQAIQLQKKKLWTHWLNADGLNPLAIGLRIARNIAGGGDRAAAKLELARLTARRAELETNLRQTIHQAVWECNAAIETAGQANLQLLLIEQRIKMAEVAYRMGESSTEAMLALWETQAEARARARLATLQQERMQEHLRRLVFALP